MTDEGGGGRGAMWACKARAFLGGNDWSCFVNPSFFRISPLRFKIWELLDCNMRVFTHINTQRGLETKLKQVQTNMNLIWDKSLVVCVFK